MHTRRGKSRTTHSCSYRQPDFLFAEAVWQRTMSSESPSSAVGSLIRTASCATRVVTRGRASRWRGWAILWHSHKSDSRWQVRRRVHCNPSCSHWRCSCCGGASSSTVLRGQRRLCTMKRWAVQSHGRLREREWATCSKCARGPCCDASGAPAG
jgi:hypothetical protein